MSTVKQILYNDSEIISISEANNATTFLPEGVKILNEPLEEARVTLLLKGYNVKKIEDRLGINPALLAGLHSQNISDTVDGYQRIVDVVFMPVIPIQNRFTLVCKVKHYSEGFYLGFGEKLDSVRVLSAEGEEYFYFRDIMKGGANMFYLFDIFIKLRDREGRFN